MILPLHRRDSAHYCTFQKRASSEVQKLPSQMRFLLLLIIITITSNEQQTHKTDQNPPITNHTFWAFWSKLLFPKRSAEMIDGCEERKCSWVLNFRIDVFLKSAVTMMMRVLNGLQINKNWQAIRRVLVLLKIDSNSWIMLAVTLHNDYSTKL